MNSIEEKYTKLSQHDHILTRPDTYIGDINGKQLNMWIFSDNEEKIIKKEILFIEGLYKIFDEILVNANDQCKNDKTCNIIKVDISNNEICVYNNGIGIEIEIHKTENVYVPELIFGHLLTSSNYNDNQKRITGGRNGYGAKLANIFSTFFSIETVNNGKKYYQEFKNNMKDKSTPEITTSKNNSYTMIKFKPDFKKFNINELSDDIINLMKKRVYDIAGINNNIKVYYNNELIKISNFKQYINYYNFNNINDIIYEEINNFWQIGILYIYDNGFDQVSFVNGINTFSGGSHIDYIVGDFVKEISEAIKQKKKDIKNIKSSSIKENMVIFLNSTIYNPTFSTQTKELLTTKSKDFGFKCDISDKTIKKFLQTGIVNSVLSTINMKETINMSKKTDGKKVEKILGIPKLEDALWAGTKKSNECFLILTEGDSAKGLAMAGREISGLDKYGIYPLKGKLLNTRNSTNSKIFKNSEINDLKKIIGLKHDNMKLSDLRYGGIIIFTDQDSVVGDTPLLLLKDNMIVIKTIDSLTSDFNIKLDNHINLKEYGICQYQVWTDKGWTSIKYIMRHKTSKRIYRIITDSGIVDVTEDHSLLDIKSNKIKPSECYIGQEILHHFPNFNTDIVYDNKTLSRKEVYDLGLEFKDNNIIPEYILNSNKYIKQEYLRACVNNNNATIFKFYNKISAMNFYYLCKSINYDVIIDILNNDLYTLEIINNNTNNNIKSGNVIKYIVDLGIIDDYVYDLETNNNHFQAGIGSLIVHNTDGYHIKGLLINFFHHFWPNLIKENFINWLATPVIKIWHNKNKKKTEFYNYIDFINWKNDNNINLNEYFVKYYKGLGTSDTKEAKEYFYDINNKLISYIHTDDDQILLGFDKNYSDKRKTWLRYYDPNYILKNDQKIINTEEYINGELRHFSNDNNKRAIPILYDGLKPSQRKILYTAFKRKIFTRQQEKRVQIFAGSVIEETFYHHGEASIIEAIVSMSQNFIGSNNINLLYPSGTFGTRDKGGDDHASARYINTYMNLITRKIFREEDNIILNYLNEDGENIEPEYYLPIIPMVLVNGVDGIGTGFMSKIPKYNPIDLINIILDKLDNSNQNLLNFDFDNTDTSSDIDIKPFYKGFKGEIINDGFGRYKIYGKFQILDENRIQITELPIGLWNYDYKEFLEKLLQKNIIQDMIYKSVGDKIDIIIEYEDIYKSLNNNYDMDPIYKKLGLLKIININNMNLYDKFGRIKKYKSINDIIDDYFNLRLLKYLERKNKQLEILNEKLSLLKYKILFIKYYLDGTIIIYKNSEKIVIEKLIELQFPKINKSFTYLTDIRIFDLTIEKLQDLQDKYNSKEKELNKLLIISEKDIWKNELLELKNEYNKFLKQ